MNPETDTPDALWARLAGQPALTFAHHSAGGPVATNWHYRPPEDLEPITEVVSIHGSSEAPDAPVPIYDSVPGNYVRDVLDAGLRLGFIGSGDGHDGHPGLTRLGAPGGTGGLAAILSESLTRAGVLDALRNRSVYATNGHRIWLDVRIDGHPMGSMLDTSADRGPDATGTTHNLVIRVVGTAPILRVDLIRSGQTLSLPGSGEDAWSLDRKIPQLLPGEYQYVRVVQEDGGAAWSSPIYAR
jgi:hypothetical protein